MNEFYQVFLPIFGGGCVVATTCAVLAARARTRLGAGGLLLFGTLTLWFALAAGTHYGYFAWQSSENPPDEAYADGAKLTGSVMFGWLPAVGWSVIVFQLARMRYRRTMPPPLPPQSRTA